MLGRAVQNVKGRKIARPSASAASTSWRSASVILGVAVMLVLGLLTQMRGSRVLAVTATAVTGPAARAR